MEIVDTIKSVDLRCNAHLFLLIVIVSGVPLVSNLACVLTKEKPIYGEAIKPYTNAILDGIIFILSLLHYIFHKQANTPILTAATTILPLEAFLHSNAIVSIISFVVYSQISLSILCTLPIKLGFKLLIDCVEIAYATVRLFSYLQTRHQSYIVLVGFYYFFWYSYRLAMLLQCNTYIDKLITFTLNSQNAMRQLKNIINKIPIGVGVYDQEKVIFANQQLQHIIHGKDPINRQVNDYYENLNFNSENYKELHKILMKGPIDDKDLLYKMFDNKNYKISVYADITELSEKSKKDAEKAIKQTMMQNLRHEIRTPLTIIEMILTSLQTECQLSEMASKAKYAFDAINLINLSLKNYSLYTLIERNQLFVKTEEANIKSIIEKLNPLLKESAKEKRIDYILSLELDLPIMYIDKELYSQIVFNLLINSFKYTFSGCITIKIHEDGRLLYTTIKDTGIGIPEEKLNGIYTLLYKRSTNIDECVSGIGLGLAVTKGILRIYGGDIKIYSKISEGTTITFTIPVSRVIEPESLIDTNENLKKNVPYSYIGLNSIASTCKPHCIMIVDDTMINIIALKSMLTKLGVKGIIEAYNGKEAVEKYVEFREDIRMIIMDINMPLMNGFEASKAIKGKIRDNKWIDIDIIAVTAQDTADYLTQASASGIKEMLTKPISIEILKKAVFH